MPVEEATLQLASLGQLSVSLLSVATAAGWFTYFRLKERRAKPLPMMVLAIVGGYLSAFGALFIYNRLESLGYATDWRILQDSWRRGLPMSLVIGWVEESAKAVPVLLLVALSRRVTRSRDRDLPLCLRGPGVRGGGERDPGAAGRLVDGGIGARCHSARHPRPVRRALGLRARQLALASATQGARPFLRHLHLRPRAV